MKRRFTLSVFAIMLIAITAPSNQIQAQYTYVVVQSDEFESGFGIWNDGSTEGLKTEKKYFVEQSLNSQQSLQTAVQQHMKQNAYNMCIRINQRAFGYSIRCIKDYTFDLNC